jgi:two-component system LytT family response regulator
VKGKIRTILVDDEAGCISNLRYYLNNLCPRIEIVGTATNLSEATDLLNASGIDLAFLDVQLMHENIFDAFPFVKCQDFAKVFVTAFEQYAFNAFRVSAVDYLLKPLEAAEVSRCYEKVLLNLEHGHLSAASPADKGQKLLLRQGDHVYAVADSEILFLKADGFYTNVVFEQNGSRREILVSKPINILHEELKAACFLRIHRSYVVNIDRVLDVRRNDSRLSIAIADITIPVAKRRVPEFLTQYRAM